jgi:hypothetical protein
VEGGHGRLESRHSNTSPNYGLPPKARSAPVVVFLDHSMTD